MIDYELEIQRRFGRIQGYTARIGKKRFIHTKEGVEIQGEGWKRLMKNENWHLVNGEYVYSLNRPQ